ncbi:uncharacterized protein TRIVIDRAFT_215619 [Trichoderma virens Gv29-8]|uniref:Protein ECM13 n=1 Tax=Hypocrea virens (strain Gv29-8 / FGSC 10586) TaxID=413071 RepID=G9MMI0_HYPVG|nr:uncharacterized protein TRIVIDRAFT_215619 [Trichoderma virens Gv29-8]EHK24549.1 hypothetical protein TRIVIDRAFT_215619 [Trichoderma virens Gv29-8]UKZ54819.1 hypothetical protein TrVGV298_008632 [Trichoderma virens]UKZ80601.1 hypothetical protein TrVFT333_008363 [Trichoderma virens FT-333]
MSASASLLRQATKKSMSITQTYYLAHKARAKLSREAAQPDHDLRLLVGHANLLDSLMLELAEAEREQERWFNQSVRNTKTSGSNNNRHIQWADRIEEEAVDEEYDSDSSSDSDDESDYDEMEMTNTRTTIIPTSTVKVVEDEIMGDDDLEEDYAQLELVRTPSHSNSPPELIDHDSESSDDEAMPPSPADAELPLPAKTEESEESYYQEEDFYLGQRTPAGLVSAISVY